MTVRENAWAAQKTMHIAMKGYFELHFYKTDIAEVKRHIGGPKKLNKPISETEIRSGDAKLHVTTGHTARHSMSVKGIFKKIAPPVGREHKLDRF